MKAMVYDFQSEMDFKIISDMVKRLGAKIKLVPETETGKINKKKLSDEEKEDIGMVMLIKEADLNERVPRSEIMKILGK